MRNRDPLLQAANRLNRSAPRGERLAYVNPAEENLMKAFGGSGRSVNGIPSYQERLALTGYGEALGESAAAQLALVTGKPIRYRGVDYDFDLGEGFGEFEGLKTIVEAERPGRLAAAQLDTDVLRQTLLGGEYIPEVLEWKGDSEEWKDYNDEDNQAARDDEIAELMQGKGNDLYGKGYMDRDSYHTPGSRAYFQDKLDIFLPQKSNWEASMDQFRHLFTGHTDPDAYIASIEAEIAAIDGRVKKVRDEYTTNKENFEAAAKEEVGGPIRTETGLVDLYGPKGGRQYATSEGIESAMAKVAELEGKTELAMDETSLLKAARKLAAADVGEFVGYRDQAGLATEIDVAAGRASEKDKFLGLDAAAQQATEYTARMGREADIVDVERLGDRATDAYRAQGDISGALAEARALGPGGVSAEGVAAPSAMPGDIFAGIAGRPPAGAAAAPATSAVQAAAAGKGTIHVPIPGGHVKVGRQRPQDGAAGTGVPADVNALMKANPHITQQMLAEENSGTGVSWDQGEGRKAEFMRRLTGAQAPGQLQSGSGILPHPVTGELYAPATGIEDDSGNVQPPLRSEPPPAGQPPAAGAAAPTDMTYLQGIASGLEPAMAEQLRGTQATVEDVAAGRAARVGEFIPGYGTVTQTDLTVPTSYTADVGVTGGRIGGAFEPTFPAAAPPPAAAAPAPTPEGLTVVRTGGGWVTVKSPQEWEEKVGRPPSESEIRKIQHVMSGGPYTPYDILSSDTMDEWDATRPAAGQPATGQPATGQPAGAAAMKYGTDPLRRQLMMDAQEGLGAGLTERERQNIQQASRSRATAMGRTFDPTATIDEFKQQLLEDRNRQAINRAFGQSVLGQEAGLQESDLGRSLTADLANQAALNRQREFDVSTALGAQQFERTQDLAAQGINLEAALGAGQFDIAAEIARGEADAARQLGAAESDVERAFRMATTGEQLRQTGLAAERGAATGMVGLEQQTSADPFQSILGRPSGATAAQSVMGTAQYGLGSAPQFVTPQTGLGYVSAVNTGLANMYGADKTAAAASSAGALGAAGSLAGGALGMFNIDLT